MQVVLGVSLSSMGSCLVSDAVASTGWQKYEQDHQGLHSPPRAIRRIWARYLVAESLTLKGSCIQATARHLQPWTWTPLNAGLNAAGKRCFNGHNSGIASGRQKLEFPHEPGGFAQWGKVVFDVELLLRCTSCQCASEYMRGCPRGPLAVRCHRHADPPPQRPSLRTWPKAPGGRIVCL